MDGRGGREREREDGATFGACPPVKKPVCWHRCALSHDSRVSCSRYIKMVCVVRAANRCVFRFGNTKCKDNIAREPPENMNVSKKRKNVLFQNHSDESMN